MYSTDVYTNNLGWLTPNLPGPFVQPYSYDSRWISGCPGRVWIGPDKSTYTINSPRTQLLFGSPDNTHIQ